MKAYICDMCHEIANNPYRAISMVEIGFGGVLREKKKAHLCENCYHQIVEISRSKGVSKRDRKTGV